MTEKPATKTPAKTRKKVAIPRLFNAVEDIVKEADLEPSMATIEALYDAFEKAIVKEARGK